MRREQAAEAPEPPRIEELQLSPSAEVVEEPELQLAERGSGGGAGLNTTAGFCALCVSASGACMCLSCQLPDAGPKTCVLHIWADVATHAQTDRRAADAAKGAVDSCKDHVGGTVSL